MENFRDSYFPVTWDLTKKHLRGTFWGKQYDTGRGFAVTVINGGQVVSPTNEVLRLKWEKPDNTSGYVQATIINGKFVIENIDQMFTVAGSIRADLELSVGGEFVASITFYVNVEKAVAVGAIESSSEFTALQNAVATVDNISQEIIDARQGEVSVGANITGVKSQLAEIEYQSCKSIGMVSGTVNESTAMSNLQLMLSKINAGYALLIDDVYTISGTGTTSLPVILKGNNKNAKLILKTSATKITYSSDIHLNGIEFDTEVITGVTASGIVLFEAYNTNVNEITVEKCSSEKPITIIKYVGDTTNKSNLTSLKVRDNTFHNSELIIWITDAILDNLEVVGNKNFNTQTVPYNINAIVCPVVKVTDNVLYNDISHWKSIVSGQYYAFILLVGEGTVEYKNNNVEGLKSRQNGVAVYDAYLSYDHVIYESNTWKNNVSVVPSVTSNAFFDAKSTYGTTNDFQRLVENNRFLITDELLETLTETEKGYLDLGIFKLSMPIYNFTFKNNFIDANIARLKGSIGRPPIENFFFENNTIKGNITNRFLEVMPDSVNSIMIIKNNTVNGGTNESFFFYAAKAKYKKVVISDNYVSFPFTSFLFGLNAEVCEFVNNKFTNTSGNTSVSYLLHDCVFDYFEGNNNQITSRVRPIYNAHSSTTIQEVSMSHDHHVLTNSNLVGFTVSAKTTAKTLLRVSALTNEATSNFIVKFTVGSDVDGLYVEYTNASGTLVKEYTTGRKHFKMVGENEANLTVSMDMPTSKIVNIQFPTGKTIKYKVDCMSA